MRFSDLTEAGKWAATLAALAALLLLGLLAGCLAERRLLGERAGVPPAELEDCGL